MSNQIESISSLSDKRAAKNIRLVLLSCPYNTISDKKTTQLLGEIARFKITSYLQEYPYGILPFDGVDLIATHFLLCETKDQGESYEPISGLKVVTQNQCRQFHLTFPIYGFFGEGKNFEHRKAVENLIEEADKKGENVGYFGSWTIRPDVRKDPVLAKMCLDISGISVVYMHEYLNFNLGVTAAMRRFKVEAFHRFLGLSPLKDGGEELPLFNSDMMMGDPCSISVLRAEALSKKVRLLAEKYRSLWESRLEISTNLDTLQLPKAA